MTDFYFIENKHGYEEFSSHYLVETDYPHVDTLINDVNKSKFCYYTRAGMSVGDVAQFMKEKGFGCSIQCNINKIEKQKRDIPTLIGLTGTY